MFVVRDVDATIIIPNKFLPTRCLNEFYEFRIWIVKRMSATCRMEAYPLKAVRET